MYPLGLLIIQSFVMGFCTCSPMGVKAFKLAYNGTSVFSKTLFPSTRTRPNLMNYSASLREHIALRLIHFDSRTISYWGVWGVLTISPKARICLHSSNLIVIIIIHFGDKVMQIRKAIYRGRVCSWSFSSFMRLWSSQSWSLGECSKELVLCIFLWWVGSKFPFNRPDHLTDCCENRKVFWFSGNCLRSFEPWCYRGSIGVVCFQSLSLLCRWWRTVFFMIWRMTVFPVYLRLLMLLCQCDFSFFCHFPQTFWPRSAASSGVVRADEGSLLVWVSCAHSGSCG